MDGNEVEVYVSEPVETRWRSRSDGGKVLNKILNNVLI